MSVHQSTAVGHDETLPRIFGRYLLVERLGAGGMGEIYIARHGLSGFEKLVVIKKVLQHLSADREFLSRFIDEASVAVLLQHAHVAQVFEVGRVQDEYFLSLEHVDGCDLRATMARLERRGDPMPVELALYVAREAAAGLAYAHRRTGADGKPLDLVHCDISPPNIMLSFEGEVKIIDFGIARSAAKMTETNPDRGFGKFGYLSPEQLLKGGVVDHRTDIYALGVVLYEMLTGERMFDAGATPDYRALARMVAKGIHPLPSKASPALQPYDALVARALRPNPDERFQSAADFRDAIQRVLVSVNPTISGDHLARMLADLMPEAPEQRKARAEIDKTDLEHWRREIDLAAGSTVSFALAGGGGRVHESAPPPLRLQPAVVVEEDLPSVDVPTASGRIRNISPSDAAPTGPLTPILTGEDEKAGSRWPWVALAVGALLVLVGLAAFALGVFAKDEAQGKPVAVAVAAPDPSPTPSPSPSPDPDPSTSTSTEPTVEALEPEPEPAAVAEVPEPKKATMRHHRAGRKPRPDVARPAAVPAPAAPSAAEVQARFRSARREYEKYKERFGPRLEKEWNELAHLATFAASGEKLGELDKKISQFRARMK